MSTWTALLSICLAVAVLAPPARAGDDLDLGAAIQPIGACGIFQNDAWFTWGASVVRGKDGKYHMFYARWPHGRTGRGDDKLERIFDGMRGWLKYSEIAYAVADKPWGPFRHVRTVLKGTGREGDWDQFTAHNPHVRVFDGKAYLYYIGTSQIDTWKTPADPAKRHWLKYVVGQRIGVIVADSIPDLAAGKGRRSDRPLVQADGTWTHNFVTNPSVTRRPDGTYLMMLKSRTPTVGPTLHVYATAPKPDGPFVIGGSVLTSKLPAEDPFLWYDAARTRYYAIVKDFSRKGVLTPQFGALALITSEAGTKWQVARHPVVSLRRLRLAGGKTIDLAHLERPQLLLDEAGKPLVLYAAAAEKNPFRVADPTNAGKGEHNTFNVHIPLQPVK